MIALYVALFIWVALACVAVVFAKTAGEDEWRSFILVQFIPFAGSIISILAYAEYIAKKKEKENKQP